MGKEQGEGLIGRSRKKRGKVVKQQQKQLIHCIETVARKGFTLNFPNVIGSQVAAEERGGRGRAM